VTIPVQSTGGEVLAVPASAISATADGSAQVTIEEEDGSTRFLTVAPGLSSGGLVQITALDGDLAEGDRVVVGVS
jgi:multidrug efflux pump subunit AcrA (membrane-fusion protein)